MRITITILLLTLVGAPACNSRPDDPGGPPTPPPGRDASLPPPVPVDDCLDRCDVWVSACGFPGEFCADACAQLTEPQLLCIEALPCTDDLSPCGVGPAGVVCGDGFCEPGEDESSCPADCDGGGPRCGDDTCDPGESLSNCPQDCDSTPTAEIGDDCDCGDPTFECLGTDTGCGFSLSGGSLSCFVNSGDSSAGFCTRSCDPDADDCPSGTSCESFRSYLLPDDPSMEVQRCL